MTLADVIGRKNDYFITNRAAVIVQIALIA